MAGNAGGAFTGLYQGSSGAADAAAALRPLLPSTSVYQQGSSSAPQLQNQVTTPAAASQGGGGFLSNFEHFLGGLGSETGHLAAGAASWLGHNALNLAEAPVKLGQGVGHGIVDRLNIDSIEQQNKQISGRMTQLSQLYKAGKINSTQYKLGLKDIGLETSNLDKQSSAMVNKTTLDQKASTTALIDTATTLITLGWGINPTAIGLDSGRLAVSGTGEKTAGQWLASEVAAPILNPVSATISRLATDSRAFQALDHLTQNVLQRATAEVVSSAGENMTAGQIARATAANVALKYPIYFNYMSTTANQVYQELDQKKYGDAVRTLAFNGALILSGGPIGQAIKYGGKALSGITERTFGQTSFWDELSKFYGDQTTSGFATAITKMAQGMAPEERAAFVKNLAAVEATNIHAVGGDAVAAASRVAKGMQGTYGFDLTTVSHEQAVQDMVNFAKNYRIANETAEAHGLGAVAVGRVDARDLNTISAKLSPIEDTQGRLQAWEQLKADNPNQAWANNANFDTQLKNIITNNESPAALDNAIRSVKAQFSIHGFPESVAKKMAKDGYFPIKPTSLEAPFKEGGDKLVTAHAGGVDFFTKAVKPLPILGSAGALFTKLGLSPESSSSRVYAYFNDALSRNLHSAGAIVDMQGETLQQSTDTLIKQLSSYAHDLKVPVSDMRMLTNKQVKAALNISGHEAANVQKAIAKSYLDVPLAIRGMGDRAVDWTYGLPGSSVIARRYLKIQGALRFSFNPFFQYLRVIPKTEMLSEAEGGGVISSIFQGRAGALAEIRDGLRSGGLLDQVGSINPFGGAGVTSGEAVDYAGFTGRNLNKHLLPMQERSIAGLIDSQARRMGMDWKDFVAQYPQETRDTIQMIAEYDRRSSFLNSPLARTLNIAVFPFRFDAKVATIFGRSLARSSLLTQVSVVNGLLKAHAWLNSPEGQAWYSHNAEVVKIFSYITPLASMAEVMSSLLPGHDHHLANFGELGGLPFGWIPQILDAEGLTHFNQPGVDAKTGKAIPSYVPATTKGQAAIAIQDLLGSLFSYPGTQVGLPSKAGFTRNIALGLTGANKKTDLSLQTPSLSPDQQQYQKTIQSQNTTPTPSVNYQSQPTGTTQVTPTSKPVDVSASVKTKTARKKKSDYPVMLPPGQTQVGVL